MSSPNTTDILAIVLSEDRSISDRIGALDQLRDHLHTQEIVNALIEYGKKQDARDMRVALLDVLTDVDVTRIQDRSGFIDYFMTTAAFDAEEECRWLANVKISQIGSSVPDIDLFLAENVVNEFSPRIQQLDMEVIATLPKLKPETIKILLDYSNHAPLFLRPYLVKIFSGMDASNAEIGLTNFLRADEHPDLKNEILKIVGGFSRLSESSIQKMVNFLSLEPDQDLRDKTAHVIADTIQKNPEVFQFILAHLKKKPDDANLIRLFKNKLFSEPSMTEKLIALFRETSARSLKISILNLLQDSGAVDLYAAALDDPNPNVRRVAAIICSKWIQKNPEKLTLAVMVAIGKETNRSIRLHMTESVLKLTKVTKEQENFVLERISGEIDPNILITLTKILPKIAITDENSSKILKAYLRVIQEPFFGLEEKKFVQDKLESFVYRDAPELRIALKQLLERSQDIDEIERLYKLLQPIEPDPKMHLDLINHLFYKFVQHYPRHPLDQWLNILSEAAKNNEAIRKEIPRIAQMTRANWLVQNADKDDLKNTLRTSVLEAIRNQGKTAFDRANSSDEKVRYSNKSTQVMLIEDAYEKKALKKSDLIFFFKRAIQMRDEGRMIECLIKIMQKEKISSDEILDAALAAFSNYAYGIEGKGNEDLAYELSGFLEASKEFYPNLSEKVSSMFSTKNYQRFFQLGSYVGNGSYDHDWDQMGWYIDHDHKWYLKNLFETIRTPEAIEKALLDLPDENQLPHQSVAYLTLYGLSRDSDWSEQNVRAVGKLMHQLATKKDKKWSNFLDRATYIFVYAWEFFVAQKKPEEIPDELKSLAAEAFYIQAKNWFDHPEDKSSIDPPYPMYYARLDIFEELWKANDQVLDALWKKYAEIVKEKSNSRDRLETQDQMFYQDLHKGGRSRNQNRVRAVVDFLFKTDSPTQPFGKEKWNALLASTKSLEKETWFTKVVDTLPQPKQDEVMKALGY